MVLYHIAQLTDAIVVSPSPFNADLFSNRDLHVVNATLIPLGIDKPVSKPQHQQVLHRLLTQVMVNPVNVALVEKASQGLIDLAGGGQAFANGFFKNDSAGTRQALIIVQPFANR